MSELLRTGQVVNATSGIHCTITKFLGGGGQGEVYKAQWDGREVAVKWYFETSATAEQRSTIQELINEGAPSDKFLWPLDMVSSSEVPGFGYVMALRPSNYKGLPDLMSGKIDPSFYALITASYELTKAFRQLHTKGLSYRDISFGNAFFDPINGDILICDNDNVGVNRSSVSGVLGTPDFMAPEIVRGETNPSIESDNHSLAVLLFYMLFIGHPLQGRQILSIRAWDRPARELLFGKKPVFIFDPVDKSNAAVDLAQDPSGESGGTAMIYWNLYPSFLRETFTKAFTAGLKDPDARVTELEWQRVLVRLRNSLFKCRCGTPNFLDRNPIPAPANNAICWNNKCGGTLTLPFTLSFGREIVMLNADTKLFGHHFEDNFDFSTPLAEVVRHPTDPNIWGLKNLTLSKWVATFSDGAVKDIETGRSVPLGRGVKVNFGKVVGEIS